MGKTWGIILVGISNLLAVRTTFTGGGNLYCQWELSPGSGNALCILFPTKAPETSNIFNKKSSYTELSEIAKQAKRRPEIAKVLPEAAPLRRTEPDEARPISFEFQIEVVRKASKKVHFYDEMDINTFMKL
nr:plasma membrane ATPase 4 [Tanacetum cinerariifolium]